MSLPRRAKGRALDRLARAILEDGTAPLVDGRYEILRRIGRGGMSEVFLARDRKLDREVAVKVLDVPGKMWARRFEREARMPERIDHPGLVPIYDFGTYPDGRLYYTMKFIAGRTLDRWAESEPDLRRRIDALVAVCDVVQAAHESGVIHRDLKPGNIMVDDRGRVYVLDWGIARVADAVQRTSEGTVLGSFPYLPPEQARGTSSRADARSDVFALGAILYEFLTGRPRLCVHPRDAFYAAAMCEPPVPPREIVPSISAELEAACLKALEAEPDRRFASVKEFARALA